MDLGYPLIRILLHFDGLASISQGTPPRISFDFNAFVPVLQQGSVRISLDLPPLRRGYPLGFHWISIDLPPLCNGYPLDFNRFACILQGVPLSIPVNSNGFAFTFQRVPSFLNSMISLHLEPLGDPPGRIRRRPNPPIKFDRHLVAAKFLALRHLERCLDYNLIPTGHPGASRLAGSP